MKKILLLLLSITGGFVLAQTNASAPKKVPQQLTAISSDSADFDLNIRRAIYCGNVFVLQPPMVMMRCEWLVVDLPSSGGHLSHVSAATNVVIDFVDEKGLTNHITSAKAVYAYSQVGSVTNETVTFTGTPTERPKVEYPDYTITSEPLIWDRAANHYIFHNETMIFHQSTNSLGGSNASPLKFFQNGLR